jgi:DNA polymerase-3 subunit chi
MARVDFYILAEAVPQSRLMFACRLAEKAWRLDNTVHILAGDEQAARDLDELLWTFRDGSFVPHERICAGDAVSPVTIGTPHQDCAGKDLLINLADDMPRAIDAFPRIAELVTSDEETRVAGRRRFAEYREQGHELATHKV